MTAFNQWENLQQFLAQTYLSQQPGETTLAELLVFSAQFFWMLRYVHRGGFVLS